MILQAADRITRKYEVERFPISAGDGFPLQGYRFPSPKRDYPAIVWGQAVGIAAGSYFPFLHRLSREYQVFAYDMRGHGESVVDDDLPLDSVTLDLFCEDLETVLEEVHRRVGEARINAVTHSFSGTLALRLGSSLDCLAWHKLVAFDPPVYPHDDPQLKELIEELVGHRMTQFGRKQVNWPDANAYIRKLLSIPAFGGWEEEALEAYACSSLTSEATGACKLACPPELEARIFQIAMDPSTSRSLSDYQGDVLLVAADGRAEKKSWSNRVQASIEARLPSCKRIVLKGARHMMIFERPDECAEIVRTFLGRE